MLADMEAGTIQAVVCVDQDRLTRHPAELESFIALADAKGVALANVSGELDLSTSDGRFRARIMGAVARQESEKKSERIKRQKDQAAARGWPGGGGRRFGYKPARNPDGTPTLEVVADEAEVIREIAQLFLDGMSLPQIAMLLNERGVKPTRASKWQAGILRSLFTSPSLAGLRVHRGKVVGVGNWEPIIDRATFEMLRAKIGNPRQPQGGRPPAHLLSGFLVCHKCGERMYWANRQRYGCPRPPQGCNGTVIAATPTEEIVTAEVRAVLDVPEMDDILNQTDTAASTAELEQIEESMRNLARLYAAGRINEAEWLVARDALEQRRGEWTVAESTTPTHSLAELWDNADTASRRLVIGELIESILVGPGARGVFDPERITITWRS